MKGKIVWLVVSCLIAGVMVLTSCTAPVTTTTSATTVTATTAPTTTAPTTTATTTTAPATTATTAPTKVMIEQRLTKLDGTPVVKMVEKPQYGGTARYAWEYESNLPQDPIYSTPSLADYCYDKPIMFDWDRGPAGTGENLYWVPDASIGYGVGVFCDSWNIPDPLHIEFHVRPGMKWHNKHPTWGRAVVAEDLAYHWNRVWDARWPRHDFVNRPCVTKDTDGDGKTDTVVINCNRPVANWFYEFGHVWYNPIIPKESVVAGMADWKNVSGSGAFMWTDYIPSSFIKMSKNPDYWGTWQIGNETFKLPFIDEINIIIMPQLSGRLAALRTGKIDMLGAVAINDWPSLKPLEYAPYVANAATMFFACNTPPMDNLQVRRALNMAINRQEMIDTYFGGAAINVGFPASPALPDLYVPVEKMPADVQEYYKYDPVKAEKLLDAAGFPKNATTGLRFSLKVILPAASAATTEVAEIVASYWAKVGVKLTLEPLDVASLTSRVFNGPYDVCFDWWANPRLTALNDFKAGNQWNRSKITDPKWNEMWDDAMTELDPQKFIAKIKACNIYMLQLAYGFMGPGPERRSYWQPWYKGFGGEIYLSYNTGNRIANYVWIDQALKKSMGK